MKEKIKKLFQKKEVDKQTSLIKLILWLLFIIILFIFIRISSMIGK